MIDMQLIHTALAGIGIASAAAVLIAVAVLMVAAVLRDRRQHHAATPVAPSIQSTTQAPREPAPREPALR